MITSLQEGVVSLIRDLNGNHVIQRCLQRLGPEDSQFVYDAACAHTMEIATHRHGCCVLQRCIDFATPVQKKLLVAEIAANALPLSQVCPPCQVATTLLTISTCTSAWHSLPFCRAIADILHVDLSLASSITDIDKTLCMMQELGFPP